MSFELTRKTKVVNLFKAPRNDWRLCTLCCDNFYSRVQFKDGTCEWRSHSFILHPIGDGDLLFTVLFRKRTTLVCTANIFSISLRYFWLVMNCTSCYLMSFSEVFYWIPFLKSSVKKKHSENKIKLKMETSPSIPAVNVCVACSLDAYSKRPHNCAIGNIIKRIYVKLKY